MKKIILVLALFATSMASYADTKFIHRWVVGSGMVWQTAIHFSNVCNQDDVDVTFKFWKADGTVLANQVLSAGQTTDSNGEISFSLTPHKSGFVFFEAATVQSTFDGSASVTTSYAEPGVNCLVGGYDINANTSGINNPSWAFIINNGDKF